MAAVRDIFDQWDGDFEERLHDVRREDGNVPTRSPRNFLSDMAFLATVRGKEANVSELSEEDVIIALVGPTGAGKSTFVNVATGCGSPIGHGLQSCTRDVNAVRVSIPELTTSDIILIDTPGFDGDSRPDADIFRVMASWLKEIYNKNIELSGVLYLHRISDIVSGTSLANLRKFETLWVQNRLSPVVLVTTMWDEVDAEEGGQLEEKLVTGAWKTMLSQGSTVLRRFDGTRLSAFRTLGPLIEAANQRNRKLLEKEFADLSSSHAGDSNNGAALYLEMYSLVNKQQGTLDNIREEMQRPVADEKKLKSLMGEYQSITSELKAASEKMERMELRVGDRTRKSIIVVLTWKWFMSLLLRPAWLRGMTPTRLENQACEVRMAEVSSNDAIILMLGLSGSGKSHFIYSCTGYDPGVNNTLTADARRIKMVKHRVNDSNVVFVDTPGFDQSKGMSNAEVVKKLNSWLDRLRHNGMQLCGVLYLHGVCPPNLSRDTFLWSRSIWEAHALPQPVLVTTMWDCEKDIFAAERTENSLKMGCWRDTMQSGSAVKRFLGTSDSAQEILSELIHG